MKPPIYIGKSIYDGHRHTRIEPIALAEEGAWRVYTRWLDVFPHEGLVFAPTRPSYAVGTPFAFDVVSNVRSAGSERDDWLLGNFEGLVEVLDYRRVDRETARRAVLEAAASAPSTTSSQLVVALSGSACVVLPRVEDLDGSWRYDVADYTRIPLHALDDRLFNGDRIDGRWIAVPGFTVGVATGLLDWSPDAELLEAVLKKLRRLAPRGGPEPPFTRAQISRIVTYLSWGALLPEHAAEFHALRDRLPTFLHQLRGNTEALDEVVSAIIAIDGLDADLKAELEERGRQAKAEIDAYRARYEAEVRAAVQRRVEAEVAAKSAVLDERQKALWDEIQGLEEEAGRLRVEEAEARSAVETLASAWRREVAEARVAFAALHERAPDAMATHGGRLEREVARTGRSLRLSPSAMPPWGGIGLSAVEPSSPWTEFHDAITETAALSGFDKSVLCAVDLAARGGSLVLLPDSLASPLVEAYARAVAGGDVRRQALDPAVFGVDDLWRNPATGTPTALAWAWTAAEDDPERYVVLLLDGVERTAADLWTPPFLERLNASTRPGNLLVFAALGERWYDRDRSGGLAKAAVIPIAPLEPLQIPPEMLATLYGSIPRSRSFSPAEAPSADPETALPALYALGSEPFTARRRAVRLLQASWPYRDEADPAVIVRAALGTSSLSTTEATCKIFVEGRAWLARALTPSAS